MKILVTGGAGFIGSNLVEELSKKNEVIVFDNFSTGRGEFLEGIKCEIIKGDIRNFEKIKKAMENIDEVYHLAADPDVKGSYYNPIENFKIDCEGTVNVLEACRVNDVKKFIFASSSVVYGIAKEIPTPESAEIHPISNYGAAKASSENYTMSYSHLYGLKSTILRYANIIGPKCTHGVIYDFYKKLNKNKNELEILGNGHQKKSYLHVKDCVSATIFAKEHTKNLEIFNIGSEVQISVREIADIVSEFMEIKPRYKFTGGEIGWPGDVPKMLLSIEKLKKLGWKPKHTIKDAILDTLRYLSLKS